MSGVLENESKQNVRESTAFLRLQKFLHESFSIRMLGFAFSRMWIYLGFLNVALLASTEQAGSLFPHYISSTVVLTLVLFVAGGASESIKRLLEGKVGLALTAGLCIAGTLAIPLIDSQTPVGSAVLSFSAIAMGVGNAFSLLLWGNIYGNLGAPTTASESSLAHSLATLPVPFITLLPGQVQLTILVFIPVISVIILSQEMKKQAEDGQLAKEPSAQSDGVEEKALNPKWRTLIIKFMASSLMLGIIAGLLHAVYAGGGGPKPLLFQLNLALPVAALFVGILMVSFVVFKRHINALFTYHPVLIFFLLGCFFLPSADKNSVLAYIFVTSGHLCFEIMGWTITSDFCYRSNMSNYRIIGLGRGTIVLGILMGVLAGYYVENYLVVNFENMVSLSFLMAFVLVITYTTTFTNRDMERIVQDEDEAILSDSPVQEPPRPLSFEEKTLLLAEEYNISDRAVDVLLLLARGRSADRIGQELYMSKGTVNTYMRSLYQITGVHSRQELLDLIENIENKE